MTNSASIHALLACIRGGLPLETDWPSIIATANRTLTTGTMAQHIRQSDSWDWLPADVQSFLLAIYERAVQRNRRLDAQLAEAVSCLNRHDIQPILIKGVAMRFTPGAGGFEGRMLSDLDLMIPASAMRGAADCLGQIGYRYHSRPSADGAPTVLFREHDVGMLDLHSRLKSPQPCVEDGDVRGDCIPIRIEAAQALLPSPTSQALILILHDQLQDRDYWRGLIDLRHLLDLDGLARTSAGIDWGMLAMRFPAGYPQRALQTQLVTANRLLATRIPAHLMGGWWPRAQHARRTVQARWPYLRVPLTLISLALDPPSLDTLARGGTRIGPRSAKGGRSILPILASGLRRFSRPTALGKL